jgi:hypothetical protein
MTRRASRLARVLRVARRAPPAVRVLGALFLVTATWLAVNWVYQVVRKPAELFFPVSGILSKTPAETWRMYAPLFRAHSTATVTPEFLAALAQVEGAGNPIARTYWRWRLSWNPFHWYQPASSAVGMYQITDGTFREARRYCIHDHAVVEAGAWSDWHGCWFNALYTRVIPGHAIEMTSALLDHQVAVLLRERSTRRATQAQKLSLAAVIHLCGLGGGEVYLQHGFRAAGLRCGSEDASRYLADVHAAMRVFLTLSRKEMALVVSGDVIRTSGI